VRDVLHFDPAEVAVDAIEDVPLEGRALHIEIGFGKDVRILREAEAHPDEVYVGVEISRKKCVKFCKKVARANLRNVYCHNGDARRVVGEMLGPGSVSSFAILFPDPWPKRKHHKHRWLQAETATQIQRALRPGGEVIVATDHDPYIEHITKVFEAAGLTCEYESRAIPESDKSLFAARFERLGETVTYQRWRRN
jgi:tRNA (guanine-N7-)-methyltransferase